MAKHKLPSNKETKHFDEYIQMWRDKASIITRLTGLRAYAYDPEISFTDKEGHTISLPIWFIDMLSDGIKDL